MDKYWIVAILILAATLRIYGLERGDTVNDEIFYAFRAIGPLDFDKAETQKTPLEWWDSRQQAADGRLDGQVRIPWWTSLSFHDHPPLVFWVQHVFIKIFGENNFAFRFPSALLGVASVYLVYLIGCQLFFPRAGLMAAALIAVTLNNVYIARTGMQEPYIIFFMLLASYLFLKAMKNDTYLIWTGIALGLGFLAKYNAFILVPILFTHLLFYKREYFKNKKFWLGVLLTILIFSPVIFYNVMLYRAVGHFDFQISHIIGQVPEGWREAPGKEIGTLGDRIKNFIPRLIASHSWLFLILFGTSLLFLRNAFLFLVLGFLFLLLLLVSPSYRFLTMLTPWMALGVGAFLQAGGHYLRAGLMRKAGKVLAKGERALPHHPERARWASEESDRIMPNGLFVAIIAITTVFEIFYSYNNQIAYYPKGPEPWMASKIRYENYNWGYNELGKFLEEELKNKMPAFTFRARYQFIEELQDKSLQNAEEDGFEPYPALFVYYGNFDEGGRLWNLDRLNIYRGWPIISLETYFQYLQENGFDYYDRVGFQYHYFIVASNIVEPPELRQLIGSFNPILIKNPRGDTVFKIYKIEM